MGNGSQMRTLTDMMEDPEEGGEEGKQQRPAGGEGATLEGYKFGRANDQVRSGPARRMWVRSLWDGGLEPFCCFPPPPVAGHQDSALEELGHRIPGQGPDAECEGCSLTQW
jgi:hypothetical protein